MTDLVALGVQTPQINTVGNFQAAQTNATNQVTAQQQQHEQAIEMGGQLAYGLLDGNPEGEVKDPVRVQQAVHLLGGPDSPSAKALVADPTGWARQMAHTARSWYALSADQKQSALADYQLKAADPESPDNVLKRQYTQAQIDALNAKPAVQPTDDQRELSQINEERKAKGADPLSMEDFLASKSSGNGLTITGPDGTVIQQGGKAGNAYDVETAKALVKQSTEIATAGRSATDQIGKLSKMKDMLSSDQVYTGPLAGQVEQLQRLAKTFGVDSGVKDTETFNALTKAAVLDKMGGSLGTGVSNADRDYIDGQVPSLQNTKEGNLQLIDVMQKVAQRQIDIAKLAADYKDSHGGRLDYKWDGYLAAYAEAHPLFPEVTDAPAKAVEPAVPAPDATPAAPAVGTIDGGYRFKGGDPGDQRNWEAVN